MKTKNGIPTNNSTFDTTTSTGDPYNLPDINWDGIINARNLVSSYGVSFDKETIDNLFNDDYFKEKLKEFIFNKSIEKIVSNDNT